MITFYLLLLIPITWGIFVKFVLRQTISWLEMFAMIAVSAIIIAVVYSSGVYSQTRDTLVINGQVTAKEMNRVHCRHSYQCNCRTRCSGSGKNRSCSTVCDTCYDHSFDNDWDVHTTIGGYTINTIDRQGLKEPPRWTQVQKTDPVSRTESYTNYVKAVPESLFNFNMKLIQDFKDGVPGYPLAIYDYYKIDRFIAHGVTIPDVAQWNADISFMLGELGPSKQVNAVVVVTKETRAMYAKALQASWIGGKKNDVVIVIGTTEYPNIAWVDVFGWSKNGLFNVQLRDDIIEIATIDRAKIIPAMRSNILKTYVRKPMADYKYLEDQIEPPMWVIILAIVLSIVCLGFLTHTFHKIDLVREFRN